MIKPGYSLDVPILGRARCCLELLLSKGVKGKKVADIGCTFGWLEKELQNSGAVIDAIDPNKDAVSFAQDNIKNKNWSFRVGDAQKIPLKNNTYDIAVFFDVIEHLPKNREIIALKEINRVLKEGGVLLLTTPNSHPLVNFFDPAWYFGHRHYSGKKIKKMLAESNFKIIKSYKHGGVLSIIYLLWFYFSKWLLCFKTPIDGWLERMDDKSHKGSGFYTHFLVAEKK